MTVSRKDWCRICSRSWYFLDIDKYIKYDFIKSEFGKGKIGLEDIHGLGDLRWFTPSGSLRSLIGSSAKVSKAVSDNTGTPARIGQMFLSPARECFRPSEDFFPTEGNGWRAGSANDRRFFGLDVYEDTSTFVRPNHFGLQAKPKMTFLTMCAYSSKCQFTCLLETGNIKLDTSARSRYCKTWFWLTEPLAFLRLLLCEIMIHSRKSHHMGMQSYFRLNGLSDVFWENYLDIELMARNIVGFGGLYDYTKAPLDRRGDIKPHVYHLTYSWDEKKNAERNSLEYLKVGHSVSMVVPSEKKKKPKELVELLESEDFVVDGDLHDGRFSDPSHGIVLLRNKGNLRTDTHLGVKNERQIDLITPTSIVKKFANRIKSLLDYK